MTDNIRQTAGASAFVLSVPGAGSGTSEQITRERQGSFAAPRRTS